MIVIKRDGREVEFDKERIVNAIIKAFVEVDGGLSGNSGQIVNDIAHYVETNINDETTVENIQDMVENRLMDSDRKDVARAYIIYRNKRNEIRQRKSKLMLDAIELLNGDSEYWNTENSNKNPVLLSTQRDYMAGILSTEFTKAFILDSDIVEAHEEGIIHFHDADYQAQNAISNCCLINLEDMLQHGTCINKVKIEKPHRLLTATTVATQIITAVTSSQYGGATISLTHLAPFVRDSYNKYLQKYRDYGLNEDDCLRLADIDIKKEITDSVQTFNYQTNSMTTTNGQSPFLSVCMYLGETSEYKDELAMLIEEFLKQRIEGIKNEVGAPITQAFPKLLYILEEDNVNPDSKYYYLTKLAAKCTAKRLVPDYISEKVMKRNKVDSNGNGNCFPCMGCRSFLSPYIDGNGNPKYYGRFNQGVVTLNLVDLALSSNRNIEKFWELFEERTELCHRALRTRHERLKGTVSDVAPIIWQDGAFARLGKGEKIDKLLFNNYSTISLGYAGLYECVKYMTGSSHTDCSIGESFAVEVMTALNDKCDQWKKNENIGYSLYGTPIENTTYKFAKCLKKRFGKNVFIEIDGHDRDYITNSYHVNVTEEINPFEKLKIESKFQDLSQGGAVSYIETCDLTNNIDAVLELISFIYNNIMYAELNTKSDYCQICGYDGEIKVVSEDNDLIWECPNCGNRDKSKLNVARRTCGYIGSNFWSKGRTNEIQERYVHLDDHVYNMRKIE